MLTAGRTQPVIVWFRRDFRLADNAALHAAIKLSCPVLPIYAHAPQEESAWQPGAASRWWLRMALLSLDSTLRKLGSRLLLADGKEGSAKALLALAHASGARAVYWNRLYEPALMKRDRQISELLNAHGIETQSFPGALLIEPDGIHTKTGGHYQVFTPFWRQARMQFASTPPLTAPQSIEAPEKWPRSLTVEDIGLRNTGSWEDKLAGYWVPDENAAHRHLDNFTMEAMDAYETGRDIMGEPGTSKISPYLHWGHITPGQIVRHVEYAVAKGARETAAEAWLRQVFWREFAHHLLAAVPTLPDTPLRRAFDAFPWSRNPEWLERWQTGRTGYPIVDAAMRELWETGWMHNRARMIVGSFLVKDLLLDWRDGERWFWDTLVDASLANNSFGWQWIAGCGADAAPYFRIFNPTSQGERYDAGGAYIRRWIPELAALPDSWIHKPWLAPADVLRAAGVIPGNNWPYPIVDHSRARIIALDAYQAAGR